MQQKNLCVCPAFAWMVVKREKVDTDLFTDILV